MRIQLEHRRRYTEALIYQHTIGTMSLEEFLKEVRNTPTETIYVKTHLEEVLKHEKTTEEEKIDIMLYLEGVGV